MAFSNAFRSLSDAMKSPSVASAVPGVADRMKRNSDVSTGTPRRSMRPAVKNLGNQMGFGRKKKPAMRPAIADIGNRMRGF